jgi:hypothetical protein
MMLLQPIWIASGLSNKQWSTRVKPASSNWTVDLREQSLLGCWVGLGSRVVGKLQLTFLMTVNLFILCITG